MVKRVFGNAIPGLADLTPPGPLPFKGRERRGLSGCSFAPLSSREGGEEVSAGALSPPSLHGKGEKRSQRVLFLPPLFPL
jgi:hypothetical protein